MDRAESAPSAESLGIEDWKVRLIRDLETDRLYREFAFPLGQGRRKQLLVAHQTDAKDIRTHLAEYTTALPFVSKDATDFVCDLIKNAPSEEQAGTAKCGWKDDRL